MAEVVEGHIRFHITDESKEKARAKAVEELIGIAKSYLK